MWTNNSTSGNDSTVLPPVRRDDDAGRKYSVAWIESCVIVYSAFTVLIIVLNLVLLIVVLSSSSLRSNPRNKFLLNLVVCHLLVGATGTAFDAEFFAEEVWKHGCHVHLIRLLFHLFVVHFVMWWGVVALLLHYLTRLLRYEGPRWFVRLPSILQRAALPLAVTLPWLVAVAMLVYVVLMDAHVGNAISFGKCHYDLTYESLSFLTLMCFYLPVPTLVVLMIAVQIAYRFKSAGTGDVRSGERILEGSESGEITLEGRESGEITLEGRESVVDPPLVYILTAGLTILLMSPQYVVFGFNIVITPRTTQFVVMVSLMMLASLLPIVHAPLWLLLLRDVKEHCVQLVAGVNMRFASCAHTSTRSESTSVAFSSLQEE